MNLSQKPIFSLFIALLISGYAQADLDPSSISTKQIGGTIEHPMALEILESDNYLVVQKNGGVQHLDTNGSFTEVKGFSGDVYSKGQGGLLDVIKHPNFDDNRWLYFSYSSGNDDSNTLIVERYKLVDQKLKSPETVLRVSPSRSTPVHYGAKMAFLADGSLTITSGDGFDYREDAQRINNQMGKVLRLSDTGEALPDNPFYNPGTNAPQNWVWSYGHRNAQALEFDNQRNLLISHEHGPAGGDEINFIEPGKNYGWPVITYGKDYSGATITPFTEYKSMEQPLVNWTPSIAPSAMAIYYGDMFPELQGDLLISTLKTKEVVRVKMDGDKPGEQTSLFTDMDARFRNIYVDTDGSLLLLIDGEDGRVLRATK